MNISNFTKTTAWIALLAFPMLLFAQRNTDLLSRKTYRVDCNDIWGWTAPNGNEYALVGLKNALSIVDVSDPRNPREVTRVSGPNSSWRDIKTWGNYAYVTNETGSGIQVIDLSNIPSTGRAEAHFWAPRIDGFVLSTCHNIYIDEFGIAYLAGCNLNGGGPIFVDVATAPGNPEYIGKAINRYAHDIYVRNNLMYSSDIYQGEIAITDVSNKEFPRRLGAQTTPSRFTHNAWLSDDGKTVYTTDERANAPVAAYRVTDPTNITKLFEFRPQRSLGSGVIPHNVHVLNDFLVISHYTDGVIIVDAADPENLIEVGNYDTEASSGGGFRGAWGAYPFLPSGNILVSDIKNGLYVVKPNYVRAARLEGIVRDATSGQLLNAVDVRITGVNTANLRTNFQGEYRSGFPTAGAIEVTFSKTGYISETRTIDLESGELVNLNIDLLEFQPTNIAGQITDRAGDPILGADIRLVSSEGTYRTSSNRFGNFSLEDVPQNEYEVTVMAWGYLPMQVTAIFSPGGGNISISLEEGYQDDFTLDLGWRSFSNTFGGGWERARPTGIIQDEVLITPDGDLENDMGTECYVTGRDDAPPAFYDELSNGVTVLSSPDMDLTTYDNPVLEISTWYYSGAGDNAELRLYISNGTTQTLLSSINTSTSTWERHEFVLKDYINLTDAMSLVVEAMEMDATNPITEAAIDGFAIVEGETIVEPVQDTVAFYLEAECAMLGNAWELQRTDDASNGVYAVVPWQEQHNTHTLRIPSAELEHQLSFAFEVETAGSYEVYTRTQAVNRWHNSFWVRMDGGNWIDYENLQQGSAFQWQAVHDSAKGDSIVTFYLEPGMHYFDVSLQENATRLDKIYVVTANTRQPDGVGEEIACLDTEGISFLNVDEPKAEVFPNPTKDWFTVQFQRVAQRTLRLHDIKGQLILQIELQGSKTQLDLSNYTQGLYILSVIEETGVWQQQIIKQ
ncbi:MAG: choice-of-anchor B family protein [Bacteroidota bacterium]